jgi:hypothetical protein
VEGEGRGREGGEFIFGEGEIRIISSEWGEC